MLTEEQIALALQKKAGNITDAAEALKVTRQALHKRIQGNDFLKQVVTDARETLVDIAESQALKQIKLGNTAIIIFTLKTLGKSRGYVERQEISGPNGTPQQTVQWSVDEWQAEQEKRRQQAADTEADFEGE